MSVVVLTFACPSRFEIVILSNPPKYKRLAIVWRNLCGWTFGIPYRLENLLSQSVRLSGFMGAPLSCTNKYPLFCQRSPFFNRSSEYQARYAFKSCIVSLGREIRRILPVLGCPHKLPLPVNKAGNGLFSSGFCPIPHLPILTPWFPRGGNR